MDMESLRSLIVNTGAAGNSLTVERVVLNLLLAFVLGQVAAWTYMLTHSGISYSRAFVQSIILLCIIVALIMMIIGNNIGLAFGLIGALAVIRFRNILKDTRDTAFVFFSLVVGMATGTGNHALAIIGTVFFCLVVLYLRWSDFGSRMTGDGFVRFQYALDTTPEPIVEPVLDRHCRAASLVSQRFHDSGERELAYRLVMRDPAQADTFVTELKQVEGISHVTFVLNEEHAEL